MRSPGFTGIDDPYEPPLAPEIILPGGERSAEDAAAVILVWLAETGVISRHAGLARLDFHAP